MDGNVLAHLLQTKILPPSDVGSYVDIVLRWVHLVAGITWIGLLYFFNLVSFPVMQKLDAPARGRVIPALLPAALWWFRWSAVVTVLAGFVYWVLILRTEPSEQAGAYLGRTIGLWFGLVVVTFAVQMGLFRLSALTKNTWLFVILMLFLVGGLGHLMMRWIAYPGASNRALAIAVGGGIGLFLLLNVWGVVWPAQKRLLAWTRENPTAAPPPALAVKLRQAYLASRVGLWLTLPMLFFMAAASHFPLFASD